jgi:hypothetical protein
MDPLRDVLPDLEGVEDKELRDLIERAHRVAQLTQHPGWPEFYDYLVSVSMSAQNRLCDGYVTSMEEYNRLVGKIEGIREAIFATDKLNDLVRRKHEQAFEYMEEVEFDRGG